MPIIDTVGFEMLIIVAKGCVLGRNMVLSIDIASVLAQVGVKIWL